MKTTSKTEKRAAWRTETNGNVKVPIYRREKLHKPSGKVYQVFEVADYTVGQRRLQSFSDQADAIAEAQRIGRLLATGETSAASLRGTEAASYGRAIELLRAAGLETPLELVAARYAEAAKALGTEMIVEAAKFYAQRNPANREARTVQQVADELVALKENRKASARYVGDLRARLNTLAKKFSMNVDMVTTPDLQAWFDGMDAAPRTVRNFRSHASTLFKFAEARGYIAKGENPVAGTEQIKSKSASAIEIYSPKEIRRLLTKAPEDFQPIIAIQAFAGLRSAEVMRLQWQDLKLDRGHIEITAGNAKTASRRIVPILPNLAEWLKPHAKKTGLLFQPNNLTAFNKNQNATSVAAKVTWKANALRHSFISYRVAEIQNVAQVALEAGNSPAMIFGHYRELVTADDAKAWFAIAPAQPANKRANKPAPFVSLPSRGTTPVQQLN
jgi:integrase